MELVVRIGQEIYSEKRKAKKMGFEEGNVACSTERRMPLDIGSSKRNRITEDEYTFLAAHSRLQICLFPPPKSLNKCNLEEFQKNEATGIFVSAL